MEVDSKNPVNQEDGVFIEVDSSRRIGGDDNDFTYNIEHDVKDCDRIVLASGAFARSSYTIPEDQNFFTLQEGLQTEPVIVTPGLYTRRTFMPTIVTALNAASPNDWVYACSYSALTNRWTFTVTGNGGVQPSFIFDEFLYEEMGFLHDTTNAFVANSITSAAMVNFGSSARIYVYCDMCRNPTRSDVNLLQAIEMTSEQLAYERYQCPNLQQYSRPSVQGSNGFCRFWFTTHRGVPYQFNGKSVLFSIRLFRSKKT